jgi:hypothetical protein
MGICQGAEIPVEEMGDGGRRMRCGPKPEATMILLIFAD